MPRKEKKFHFIYKTTNLLSGKYYIGMHSTDNLEDGYLGSGKRLRYSVNKYGKENHMREILEYFDTREELARREREVVCLDEIAKKECMNLCVGGEGGRGFTSEEQKLNALKSHKKQLELKLTNPEWVETRSLKLSEKLNEQYFSGHREKKYFYSWSGKTHSSETIKRMVDSRIGLGLGKTNSQYGTCWITKDGENKKIKKDNLEHYVHEGWEKGRI